PGGIAMDRTTNRIFTSCGDTSKVIDGTTGKVVAKLPNGGGVDGLAFDPTEKLIYIPSGSAGNVTVIHEDSPDKYSVVATVQTMRGAGPNSGVKTYAVCVFGFTVIVRAPRIVCTVATTEYLSGESSWITVTFPAEPLGM